MCLLNNLKLSLHLTVRTRVCFCQLVMTNSEYLKSTYEVMHAFGQVKFVVYGLDAKFLHPSQKSKHSHASFITLKVHGLSPTAFAYTSYMSPHSQSAHCCLCSDIFRQEHSCKFDLVIIWYFIYECASHGRWVSPEPSVWMKKEMLKWGKDARLGLVLVCCGVSLTASICQSTTLYF